MFKTLETFHKLEECTSGCPDGSSQQQSRHLRYKDTGKNTCDAGVCPCPHSQDYKVRIKGNRTVALSLQTKVLCNTDVLKIEQEDKMSRPCRHTSKHGSFHTPRCAVTADVPKILPLQLSRQIIQYVMAFLCSLAGRGKRRVVYQSPFPDTTFQ